MQLLLCRHIVCVEHYACGIAADGAVDEGVHYLSFDLQSDIPRSNNAFLLQGILAQHASTALAYRKTVQITCSGTAQTAPSECPSGCARRRCNFPGACSRWRCAGCCRHSPAARSRTES